MTALKWITNEAKHLKKKYPHRYKKWTDYVAQASAIYKSKHGSTPVGKPHRKKVKRAVGNVTTKSKSHTDKNRITANIQVGSLNAKASQGMKEALTNYTSVGRGIVELRAKLKREKNKQQRLHLRAAIEQGKKMQAEYWTHLQQLKKQLR